MTSVDIATPDSYCVRDPEHRTDDVSRRAYTATRALFRERPDVTITTRAVATRAGVPHHTLRAVFPSPDILVAAACLEGLRRDPAVIDFEQHPPERVRSQFIELLTRTADDPGFALCCARILTGRNPAVRTLRARIDAELRGRLDMAVGPGAWPEVCQILHFGLVGAIVTTICSSSSPPEIESRVNALISTVFPASTGAPWSRSRTRGRGRMK